MRKMEDSRSNCQCNAATRKNRLWILIPEAHVHSSISNNHSVDQISVITTKPKCLLEGILFDGASFQRDGTSVRR